MTNNDTNNEYTALLSKSLSTMKTPAEPNTYKSEVAAYLEKADARRQAARERLGITEEMFKEPGRLKWNKPAHI